MLAVLLPIMAAGLLVPLVMAAMPVSVELRIADLQREGLKAQGVRVRLEHRVDRADVRVHLDRLLLPGLDQALTGLEFSCPGSARPWPALSCTAGRLELAGSPWGRQQLEVALDWDPETGLRLGFSGLRYAGDRLGGRLEWKDGDWKLSARVGGLALEKATELRALGRERGLAGLSGTVSGSLELSGDGAGVRRVVAGFRLKDLAYADEGGEQAAEKVAARIRLQAGRKGKQWSGSVDLRLAGGELYSDPVFLDIGRQPLHLTARGRWEGRSFSVQQLDLDGGRMLKLRASGRLDTRTLGIRRGEARIDSDDLGRLYRQILQPLLVDTPLDDLEVEGDAGLRLRWAKGRLTALDGSVDRIDLDHRRGSFGANGVSAQLFWRAEGKSPDSRVRLEGGHIGRVGFGGTGARFNAVGRSAWLREPVRIPFHEGRITLSDLSWVQSSEGPDVGFSASISEVSLEGLTTELGWPRMRGRLNGGIPRARYRRGSLLVSGDLVVDVFDGRVVVRGLRLDELGSAAPVLQADVELRRLDLSQLTQAFSLGEIQGRLDGEVRGLQLVAWQPDRFDARFYSTPDDDLRHRISQRAVENLSELGNGVSGALSASFLRFFEEFSYDRIELRVRQEGDRAWIDGIPAGKGGYYLVKGAGIPRIDVIGRNREVAWSDLLARLRSIRVEGVKMQ